ncbi:MAG: tRNA 2-thiocytidine(32) synthetase TtcA [Clostridia bacterium]|nr:tRNA 2-thiocytidine(32) synthetase TtcA [Clostridia bacterium]
MELKRLLSVMRKGINDYKMIKDGDNIAVGLSGGKDSVTLLKLLASYRNFSPEKFTLSAITVDLSFTGQDVDYTPLKTLCDELDVPFYLEKTQIGEIVFDVRQEQNPCALCSKMRKGALYKKAVALGCNKVALGHHRDDMIDTMLLSLLYEGRLSTFAPKSFLDKTGLTVIRPMIYIEEVDVSSYAKKNLPIVKSCCPANKNTKREEIKDVVKDIQKRVPDARNMMFSALTHPERYNLFDKYKAEIDLI